MIIEVSEVQLVRTAEQVVQQMATDQRFQQRVREDLEPLLMTRMRALAGPLIDAELIKVVASELERVARRVVRKQIHQQVAAVLAGEVVTSLREPEEPENALQEARRIAGKLAKLCRKELSYPMDPDIDKAIGWFESKVSGQ